MKFISLFLVLMCGCAPREKPTTPQFTVLPVMTALNYSKTTPLREHYHEMTGELKEVDGLHEINGFKIVWDFSLSKNRSDILDKVDKEVTVRGAIGKRDLKSAPSSKLLYFYVISIK